MATNEIYNNKITRGSRTYFFDIKKSEHGVLYLKISACKKTKSGYEYHRIMVFDEDFNGFVETLKKTLKKFEELKDPKDSKTYLVEQIRTQHQQAYLPWTAEDDNKLEVLFCEGRKAKELAKIFERNEGAIRSRIRKLELKAKYGS